MKNGRKKILEKNVSSRENHVGIVSLKKTKKEIEFTVRILDVKHIHYSFDPKTQKFQVQFFSNIQKVKKWKRWRNLKTNVFQFYVLTRLSFLMFVLS